MSVKLIYVLSPFHKLFLSILYQNSCKTHNISSKLGFVGFLMKVSDLAINEQYIFKMRFNRVSYNTSLGR